MRGLLLSLLFSAILLHSCKVQRYEVACIEPSDTAAVDTVAEAEAAPILADDEVAVQIDDTTVLIYRWPVAAEAKEPAKTPPSSHHSWVYIVLGLVVVGFIATYCICRRRAAPIH